MLSPQSRRTFLSVLLIGVAGLVLVTMLTHKDTPTTEAQTSPDMSLLQRPSTPLLTSLAQKYIYLDRAYLKWLWWPFLAYLFWGMAHVCDEFFVRTIEVISERFNIPDDVAGATLMALGCNGPEMALNTISIFNPSDIGVGAVIGGEVFNVLVIIGTAMLATPDTYLPLRISRFSFFRDVLFYMVSVAMLYNTLKDGEISRTESLTLIAGAVVYSTTVAATSRIRAAFYRCKRACTKNGRYHHDMRSSTGTVYAPGTPAPGEARATRDLRRSASIAEVVNGPRASKAFELLGFSPFGSSEYGDDPADDSDFENEAEPELIDAWDSARKCDDPFVGSVVGVRVEVRSRMMDRSNKVEERYMWLTETALMVSSAVAPDMPVAERGRSAGMVCDVVTGWHYGGLVHAPNICDGSKIEDPRSSSKTADLRETGMGEVLLRQSRVPSAAGILGLHEVPCEAIPFKDVLYCDPVAGNPKMFTLHVHQGGRLGLGRLITIEFLTTAPSVHDAWAAALLEILQKQSNRLVPTADHPPPPATCGAQLKQWVEWIQFPVKFLARNTIPDMDRPELQHWYPVAFVMSMAWLAVFAYLVVSACMGIHEDFGIPTGVLGFTIAAAGTSFPNVFSGMVVSRQGKTTMAVANALGANVQNVFLALAVPWCIQSCFITHGSFPMPVQGLFSQVAAIYITLIPLVLIFICSRCTLPGWSGYVFLATYVVYLINALGMQSTGCLTLPVNCN